MHEPWRGWIKFNICFMLQNIQKWELAPKNITWLTRTGEKQQKVIWCSGRSTSSYQISFERSHSIFPCPFSGQLIVLLSVSFVDFSYFWNQRIIGIRITQQRAYRQQNWNNNDLKLIVCKYHMKNTHHKAGM